MRKLSFIFALTFITGAYAFNSCEQSCQRTFDQNSLVCFKAMQLCLKSGPVGNEGMEMCQDDFQFCLRGKAALKEACLDSCSSIDD